MDELQASVDTIRRVFADGGYSGKLIDWAGKMFGWLLTVVKRTDTYEWVVLPKRWIVERSFTWMNHLRRLSEDYEISTQSARRLCTYRASGSWFGGWGNFEDRFLEHVQSLV